MEYREDIRFLLNGRNVVIPEVGADQTLLDFLRLEKRLTGTKEGCAEGDCGACTVLVGRLQNGALKYEAINSCIRFLASLNGCHVVTVESLQGPDGKLHPVQQAMIEHHGSQCGFCTPGFVMALYALWMEIPEPTETQIESALQGNLCRCTGYEPIVKAAFAVNQYGSPSADHLNKERESVTAQLLELRDEKRIVTGPPENKAILPASVDDLAAVLKEHPEATIIAGSTDVGLWLRTDAIEIGAGVTYSECENVLAEAFPHLADYWDRIAGWQVRNMGTIGGNIANGSPIGDIPPVFIALDAEVTLRRGSSKRSLPLHQFFIDYGKQDREPGDFVETIRVPRPKPGQLDAAYKISKRRDEDISSVAVGISIEVNDGTITDCRIAFGGMAATPKRGELTEAALRDQPWGASAFEAAAEALSKDFAPLTDWRASKEYRMSSAAKSVTQGVVMKSKPSISGSVHTNRQHDSAIKHVTGQAEYCDDIAEPVGTLHAYLGASNVAHAKIKSMDLSAVETAPGVIGVITADDIPGVNDISPTGKNDEPVFPTEKVEFHGQPLFAVIAETRDAARRAAELAILDYELLPHALDPIAAQEADYPHITDPLKLERGEIKPALSSASNRIKGRVTVGGQDHMYLEGHIAFVIPGEDDDIIVHSSTQHPSEAQHMVAHVMGIPSNAVTVNVRRMGGGFGGKESQMNLFCAVAAIAAKKYNRAVKIRPDRDQDMTATGKRHDFVIDYDVAFDDEGCIEAVDGVFAARCGYSSDLSGPVTDRALFHADNAYFYPNVRLVSHPMKTNTVSNTAFRGFGGPQGVVAAERIIEEIAYATGKDPLDVRKANFYDGKSRKLTPYHQEVNDSILDRLISELEDTCEYRARRKAILEFNASSPIIKKGIALTPVKFGISFTATWYNQAGALIHVYNDGSIHLNHGGTEMGQGLNTKISQIVADAFQVDFERIKITKTTTEKVPNTSATAASSGSDLNGMAALNAAEQIKERLVDFATSQWGVEKEQVIFHANEVQVGEERLSFDAFIRQAYMARVHLSATGFYKTPDIHWDRAAGKGRPFYYFAYGAACSEVSIDTLTGEYRIERTDILHDVGRSLNPALDKGQVEGAFIQGMGWLTTEELWWDDAGRLRTHAPSTYKIPLASDRPRIFNVNLADWSENRELTIKRSKAVGEPPFMLGISVLEALSMAAASVADYRECPRLDTPATPERILMAVERLRKEG
ncbi:Xanthine dehydrogenase [Nymphon striatum]|nr:Xanthine dehydrogenase [Nymphon striatum]